MLRKYSMQRRAPNRRAMDWNYWREMKTAGRCCFEILYREIYLATGLILFPFNLKKNHTFFDPLAVRLGFCQSRNYATLMIVLEIDWR